MPRQTAALPLDAVQPIAPVGPRHMTRAQWERERRLLSRVRLAEHLHMCAARISDVEHGRGCGAKNAANIARALEVDDPESLYDEVVVDLVEVEHVATPISSERR